MRPHVWLALANQIEGLLTPALVVSINASISSGSCQGASSSSAATIIGVTRLERRERERVLRRQVIVNAARELAEAEGWESVTTRRLADCIEYSQPVLYSHFEGKDAIVSAVALEGFGELAAVLHNAREMAGSPAAEPRAVARAYLEFARANPALYQAMFTLRVDLTFAQSDTPASLRAGFVEVPRGAGAVGRRPRRRDVHRGRLERASWPGDTLPGREAAPSLLRRAPGDPCGSARHHS